MFSCLQILEAFLWFVLITLLNVTLIILTLSVSRLLNLLLRLVAFLLFLNPQCLASISRWITASCSWKIFFLFVCRALRTIMLFPYTTLFRSALRQPHGVLRPRVPRRASDRDRAEPSGVRGPARNPGGERRSEEHTSELQSHSDLVCRLLLEKNKTLSSIMVICMLTAIRLLMT